VLHAADLHMYDRKRAGRRSAADVRRQRSAAATC
jgi:hypothetical protein